MKVLRCILILSCIALSPALYAQEKLEPTSATDGNVKIQRHPKVRNLRHDNRGKKLPGEAKVFKRLTGAQRKEIYAQAPRTATAPRATPENHSGKDVKHKRQATSPRDNHSTSRRLPRNRHRPSRH